jgi:hypothetical protein
MILNFEFLGAYLIKRSKWKTKQISKFIAIILFLTCFLFLTLFFVYCPQETYINHKSSIYSIFDLQCNCNINQFQPLCYQNNFMFQSACHAGCTTKNYDNCTIMNLLLNKTESKNNALTECSRPAKHCLTNLIIACLFGFITLFLSSIIIIPLLRIILDSSKENQAFALGIRSMTTKLFGIF